MSWNPDEEEQTSLNTIIEKGAYRCIVAEAKQSMKDPETVGVQVVLQVCEHQPQAGNKYDGRKIFLYMTWANRNAIAVDIGRRKLADLLFACGISGKQYNSASQVAEDVVDKEIIANVTVGKRTDTGEEKNDVSMFFNKQGLHRGKEQKIKLYPWGGLTSGGSVQAGRGATHKDALKPPSVDEDLPF